MPEEKTIKVTGKITGYEDASTAFTVAPNMYRKSVVRRTATERDMFIGSKRRNKEGVFRKKLNRRKLWGGRVAGRTGETSWSTRVTHLFKGWLSGIQSFNTLTLRMGVIYQNKKPIHAALEFLQEGGTISAGGKMMIVPFIPNLQKKGITIKTGQTGKMLEHYDGFLIRAKRGNKIYFYDAELAFNQGWQGALMFIGVTQITVKKQFDFYADWDKRMPKVIQRMQKAVDRTTGRINTGKYVE